MQFKPIILTTAAIIIGGGLAIILIPTLKSRAAVGIVTTDCGQVQPTALGIHFTALPVPPESSGQIVPQSTGGPIPAGQAIAIANQKTYVRGQLPAPLVKTQYVSYTNDNRGVGTSAGDDTSADDNLISQNVTAWIVSYCGVVTYPNIRRPPSGQAPSYIPTRNEWNVVINAQTGQLIEEYSTR
jgi:hypothetical protein